MKIFRMMIVCASLLAGCSNAPTPEQKDADAALTKAKALLGQGKSGEGRAALRQAFALDRSLVRPQRIAEEARLLGDLAAAGGDCDSALILYALSRESYRSLADRPSVRSLTIDMALTHQRMGEDRKAFALLNDGLRMARVFKEDEGARDIQLAMLPLCRSLEQYDEGTKFLSELEARFSETRELRQQARVSYEWGLLMSASKNIDGAIKKYLESYGRADQSGDTLLAVGSLLRLALAYEESGKNGDAFAAFGDALKRAERSRSALPLRVELLTRVGNAYLRAGQTGDALRFYRAAFQLAGKVQDKIAVGTLLVQIGHCGLNGSIEASIKNYTAALNLFRALGYGPGMSYASLSLAMARERSGEFAQALNDCKAAIEQIEQSYAGPGDDVAADCEASFTGPARGAAYDETIGLLLHLGRNDEAFWYLERKNTRLLSGVFNALDIQTADVPLNEALSNLARARAAHVGAERQLSALLSTGFQRKEDIASSLNILETSGRSVAASAEVVARLRPSFAQIVRGGGTGMAEIQRALPPGTALVEYALASKGLYSFLITRSSIAVAVGPVERAKLIAQAEEFTDELGLRMTIGDSAKAEAVLADARIDALSSSLYDLAIRPIEAAASTSAKLLVVLPEELHGLPLHALRSALPKGSPFLAEKVFVSYLPTAGALLTVNAASLPVKEVVALGFPGKTGWDVEYELRDIRAFFKDARLLFNQSATLPALAKEKGDLAHIAADLHFDAVRPGTAYMVFSDGAAVAGPHFNLLGELFEIPAFPSIIISNLLGGRGAVHPVLPWIFLSNGTSALMMNSYVPSRQSKKLFGELIYTALLSGAGTQNAFRKAQLEMIAKKETAPVTVWAPYTIWGK